MRLAAIFEMKNSFIAPLLKLRSNAKLDVRLPQDTRLDERLKVKVLGAIPGDELSFELKAQDDDGKVWMSKFQHPVVPFDFPGGLEVDITHLFQTLRCAISPYDHFAYSNFQPRRYWLQVSSRGSKRVVTREIRRHCGGNDFKMEVLSPHTHGGLAGEFYFPKSYNSKTGPAPVIVFTGSGGGLGVRIRAALLASHGIPALALAYFNYPGTPPSLLRIPLEYFSDAISWVKQRLRWTSGVAVMGASRGGELALLLGATFPEVSAVVAIAPSHAVWGGFGDGSAWTLGGIDLPYMSFIKDPEAKAALQKRANDWAPLALTPIFTIAHQSTLQDPRAIIPVERIKGKVLLISGTDDQMWPASLYSKMVIERLHKHGMAHIARHLDFDGAGHAIGVPYLPCTTRCSVHPVNKVLYAYGGSTEKDALAVEGAWQGILEFLQRHR